MAGLGLWITIGIVSVAGVETPSYELESEHDGYEIRQYAPYIAAEVKMEGTFRESMNGGFRKLADYIFGNNTKVENEGVGSSGKIEMTAPVIEREATAQEIEMTAPVMEQNSQGDVRIISFIMPSEYSMETLPRPNNPDVTLVEVPAKRFAVIQFSGNVSHEKAKEKKQSLLAMLERDRRVVTGQPMLAQYDPPWTPPLMRRNEVLVELKDGDME